MVRTVTAIKRLTVALDPKFLILIVLSYFLCVKFLFLNTSPISLLASFSIIIAVADIFLKLPV